MPNMNDVENLTQYFLITEPIQNPNISPGAYNYLTLNQLGIPINVIVQPYAQAMNGGNHIWVQNTTPTALSVGDIWIQTA